MIRSVVFRVAFAAALSVMALADDTLSLTLRSRSKPVAGQPSLVSETKAEWPGARTALVIVDMWDDHWCKSAAARVNELVAPINEFAAVARSKGVLVIHAPSSVTAFYKNTPQRRLALDAPFSSTPLPLSAAERWGTHWCWTDAKSEGVLPIDDTDMGCSCRGTKCTVREAWTRQISGLALMPGDALTDNGQELWNLLASRNIDHVMLCGVHLNMCVLGRPVGIRQLVYLGKTVALIRDLTDSMYNPDRPPGVDHFTGTDLVVAHVEKYWCPSLTSTDLTDKPAFRFRYDPRTR